MLDGIDLDVAEGMIFALLGPNGAGKTTIVQILSTLIGADAGEIRVAGNDPARDPDAVRAAIGVTGQFSAVDNLLTGEENLILMADLHRLGRAEGRRRVAELLDRFDLVDAATKTSATYSGGMRRRLDLAMGLLGDPRIVFFDEPTAGLDPRSRRTMWQIIRDLVAGGHRLHAGRRALVRREPALHPDHGNPPRIADRHTDAPPQRSARHRLVRRPRARRVPVGQAPVQPRPNALTGKARMRPSSSPSTHAHSKGYGHGVAGLP